MTQIREYAVECGFRYNPHAIGLLTVEAVVKTILGLAIFQGPQRGFDFQAAIFF